MKSKPTCVISAPVNTLSGYGSHARDLIKALKDMNKFDIKIISTRWGNTPMNVLDENNDFHQWILDHLVKNSLTQKPDIWIQVTVPNEFQRVGKYNIGITAGIETTAVASEWIEGMNKMDLGIVPSEFSKKVFENTVYTHKDQHGNEMGKLNVTTPIKVLFEGFDSDVYKLTDNISSPLKDELKEIDEEFCFLFVGHWLRGDFGHDRKDVATLIKTFGDAFKNKSKKPALVLKTSAGTLSVKDKVSVTKKIKRLKDMVGSNCPPIYLIHGNLTDSEMNELYNCDKMKAMVSFTHGEGFGRPLLEYSITGKPVIAPNFSGHLDFLTEKHSVLINGGVSKVHESAQNNMIIDGSGWFFVNDDDAKKSLKDVYKNYDKYKKKSNLLGKINRKKFTLEKMGEKFQTILDDNLPKFPKEKKPKLPDLPNLKKLKTDK